MPTTEHGLFVADVRALVDWHRRDDEVFTLIDSLGMTAIDYRHDGRTWSVSVDRWSSQVNDGLDSNGWVDWLGPCLVDVPGFEPLFRRVTEPAGSVTA